MTEPEPQIARMAVSMTKSECPAYADLAFAAACGLRSQCFGGVGGYGGQANDEGITKPKTSNPCYPGDPWFSSDGMSNDEGMTK